MTRLAVVPVLVFGGTMLIGLAAFGGGVLLGRYLDRKGRGLFGRVRHHR